MSCLPIVLSLLFSFAVDNSHFVSFLTAGISRSDDTELRIHHIATLLACTGASALV